MKSNRNKDVFLAYFTSQEMVDRYLREVQAVRDSWSWQVSGDGLAVFPKFTVMTYIFQAK